MCIKTVIVPAKNDKDVKELPPNVQRGMQFVYVSHMDQVLDVALVGRRGSRPGAAGTTARRAAPRA